MRITPKLTLAFLAAIVLATVGDIILVATGHQDRPLVGSDIIDYWPVFAVVSDLIIIFGSKWLGSLIIQRSRHNAHDESDHE